jgi:hypothetical protein
VRSASDFGLTGLCATDLTWINKLVGFRIILKTIAFRAEQQEKAMSVNVGTIDRALRVVIGLALIAFAIPLAFPDTGWNWIGWIGVVPILTAIVGTCPAYSLLNFSTTR